MNTTYRITLDWPECAEGGCHVVEMHHYDDEGRHYCPTGFLWCSTHGALAGTATGPALCHLWREGTFPPFP